FLISIFVFVSVVGSSISAYEYFTETNAETEKVQDLSEKPSTIMDAGNMSVEQPKDLAKDNKLNTLQDWLEKSKPFFKCFCWFTNGEKLINTSTAEGQLPCLHGIRFLSMSWVMLGHVYSFSFPYLKNTTEALIMGDQWIFQIILRGSYSVDSFFVLSGFLVAYLFFQQYAKSNGKIPWLYFYMHRYIRLTPVYMMFLAFYTTLMAYLGSGPLWNYKETDPNCQAYWWWNLLYFNNFLTAANQCIPWSWYLANDMQFYVISPLLMVSLMRWPVVGYSLMGVFFGITFISNFFFTYVFNYPIGLTNVVKQFENFKEFAVIWTHRFDTNTKPYIRMDPYLVGIALAYYLFKRKQNNSGKLSLVTLSVGWVVASVVTLTTVFGIYHQEPNIVITSFYTAVNRSCYACGLAWVIFVCVIGQGGVVNSFLSWKFWIPLSRLTFCAYLVHPLIQTTYFASLRDSIVCSHMTMVMYHFGFLIMSYMAALVVSLLFESPVIRLERLIRNKFAS
ncbi:nose resistant to fluoxetine protein 6, partial [Trichonephila clavata]